MTDYPIISPALMEQVAAILGGLGSTAELVNILDSCELVGSRIDSLPSKAAMIYHALAEAQIIAGNGNPVFEFIVAAVRGTITEDTFSGDGLDRARADINLVLGITGWEVDETISLRAVDGLSTNPDAANSAWLVRSRSEIADALFGADNLCDT